MCLLKSILAMYQPGVKSHESVVRLTWLDASNVHVVLCQILWAAFFFLIEETV